MEILLADDHDLVRETLKFYLEKIEPDTRVIEAGTFSEALDQASKADSLDLIILDLQMPGMNRLSGLEVMRERFPDVPTVILSGVIQRDDILSAIQRGAAGVIPKTLSASGMTSALRLILAGETYLPSTVISKGGAGGAVSARDAFSPESPLNALTNRERDVLELLTTGGLTNKKIAEGLGIQEVTVKLHLRGIFRKLGASNRTQAVKIAMQLGWQA
ncbi:MAG: response regulator transcription factor [Alphaproteobacteria bacterium]